MDRHVVEKAFRRIGAEVTVKAAGRLAVRPVGITVTRHRNDERFELTVTPDADIRVLNVADDDRHLLLFSNGNRFLCGHDERHWFVAAIGSGVSTVRDAKASLLPPALRERAARVPDADRRRNKLFVRQGEWFFVPVPDSTVAGLPIHRNEPVMRPRSKPHLCEELVRRGGELVHLVGGREMSDAEWQAAVRDPNFIRGLRSRRSMMKNPEVYARGHVRHEDHATIWLPGWHRVYLNGEMTLNESVTFYD